MPSKRPAAWERIYLEDGPEGFTIVRRRIKNSGKLPKTVEEDLLAEVQCLRAENEYLKTCKPSFWKTSDANTKNADSNETEAKHKLEILLSVAQSAHATFYYHLKQMKKPDKYAQAKEE